MRRAPVLFAAALVVAAERRRRIGVT